jgi:hypothetical protein
MADVRLPPPGLNGTYDGTCIVCVMPTDTALAVVGEGEWHHAFLEMLGILEDEVPAVLHSMWSSQPNPPALGEVPCGVITELYRVCVTYAGKSPAPFPKPALAVVGARLPSVAQLPETYAAA